MVGRLRLGAASEIRSGLRVQGRRGGVDVFERSVGELAVRTILVQRIGFGMDVLVLSLWYLLLMR